MCPPCSRIPLAMLALTVACCVTGIADAQENATWSANPAPPSSFNDPNNWTPTVVPTGTAFFGATSTNGAAPLIFSNTSVDQITFTSLAPEYSIGVLGGATLEITGAGGITNESSNRQNIVILSGGTLLFENSTAGNNTIGYGNRGGTITFDNSTAGGAIFENQNSGNIDFINSNAGSAVISNDVGAGTVTFQGASSAANATINNTSSGGGTVVFTDTSNAGNSVITNFAASGVITFESSSNAGTASINNTGGGGTINFLGSSDAGSALITNSAGGVVNFEDSSSADLATVNNSGTLNFSGNSTAGSAIITTNNGGLTKFFDASTGGQARFITNSGGVFDISPLTATGMTAGSIEGAGNYFLGSKQLTVGLNDLSTQVDGVIADGGAAGGAGGSLIKVGLGTLTLNGDDTYSGGTTVSGGTIIVGDLSHPSAALSGGGPVYVAQGATFGGYGSVTGSVTNDGTVVAGNATPGFSGMPIGTFTIIGTLLNRGTVNLASDPIVGNILLVQGSYVGASGMLNLNTVLGSDNSPSDKLVISGGTGTGNTSVHINNAGGLGAITQANGIPVVQAINGATTATGAFALAGEARGGDIDYELFQGGLNGSDPNDWFLRSSIMVPPIPPEPPEPGPLPPDPPPDPLPPGVYPIIGPELATYGVVQPIARQLGLTVLGTLHERIGDTLTLANTGSPANDGTDFGGSGRSAWGRFFGQQIENHYQAFANPSADGRLVGFQLGYDLFRGDLIADHRDVAGAYFAYGNSNMGVNGLVTNAAANSYVQSHTGSVALNSYSGGLYWTHYGPGDWYLDGVLQGTHYTGNATTEFANLPTVGNGFAVSLEAGYPVPLPLGPHFVLEPQAQIIWQHVGFQQGNDGLGEVALGTTSGATGRLGVRGQWTIEDEDGQVWQPYARANVWRDWDARATTTFSGVDQVPLDEQATRLEFAGGLTVKLNTSFSLYAQAGYQFAISPSDARRDGVKGDIGVRYTW